MRKLHVAGLALLAGGLTAGAVACSSSHDELAVGSVDGVGGVGGGGTHTTTGTTTGMGGAGGGSHEDPPEQPPEDAGPDAEFTCEGLDPDQPVVLYLSADDSNSMASPVIARWLIRQGGATVDPWSIRTYEFLNYYRFSFDPAPRGELAIVSQLGSCALTGDLALQIAVQSDPVPAVRAPMTLTLVLDTSGSMDGRPIDLERQTVLALASSLRDGDIVNAVTWSVDQTPVLSGHVASGPDDPVVVAMANALQAGGGTDLHGGLAAGYQLANQYRGDDRINRVLLISDGQANVGITDETLIGDNAESEDAGGIYLIGVGVGNGYNDTLMNAVTDAGRGAYIFIDEASEASKMFVDRFPESVLVAARGVQIELTLPPYFKIQKFFGEEYSPDPAKVRPQHLAPDDSFILYQIIRACDPGLINALDPYRVQATWRDPVTGATRQAVQETTLGGLGIDDGNLAKAAAIVAYAEALKQLTPLTPAERVTLLSETLTLVQQTDPNQSDPDLVEIAGLIGDLITVNNTLGP